MLAAIITAPTITVSGQETEDRSCCTSLEIRCLNLAECFAKIISVGKACIPDGLAWDFCIVTYNTHAET